MLARCRAATSADRCRWPGCRHHAPARRAGRCWARTACTASPAPPPLRSATVAISVCCSRSSSGQPPEIRITVLSPRDAFQRGQQLAERIDARLRRHLRAAPGPFGAHLQVAGAAVAAQVPPPRCWLHRRPRRPAAAALACRRCRRPTGCAAAAAALGAALAAAGRGGPWVGPARDRRAADGAAEADRDIARPHSRWPTVRSAIRLRLAMSRASDRLPNSHAESLRALSDHLAERIADPVVGPGEVTFGPAGSSISAERSTNDRFAKNREAARADMPHVARLERALIDDEDEQPAEAGALVGADRGRVGRRRVLAVAAAVSTYSALTTRRGWPATVTVKSPAARPRIGCPCRSTTPTSTVTSSTPVLNVGTGACGDCCAQQRRARRLPARRACRPDARCRPAFVFMATFPPAVGCPRDIPAAPGCRSCPCAPGP